MHALERMGDEWIVFDRSFRVAIIRQVTVRRPTGTLWRSVAANDDPAERWLIGYFPSLEMAAAVTWRTWEQRAKPIVDHYLE